VIGAPKFGIGHPCGDVTIDITDDIPTPCPIEVCDVRQIHYSDKYFGACLCSHVLEHLGSIEDVYMAVNEMKRVSERTFIVVPGKYTVAAWLHPSHHLWLSSTNGGILVEDRATGEKEIIPVNFL